MTGLIEKEETGVINQAQPQQDQYFELISRAVQGGMEINQLEKLMELKDKHDQKEARKSFYHALSKFQSEIPVIKKRGKASFDTRAGKTEYDFAKLEHIVSDIKPYLLMNGLSFRFEQLLDPTGAIKITCVVTHVDGHSEMTSMSAMPDTSGTKNAIQSSASSVTYLQRYTLTGALGIVTEGEDSDGGKDDLGISQELTDYVISQQQAGKGPKALFKEFEEKYNLMPVVKEHIVKTQVETRLKTMLATLGANTNEQSRKAAGNGYNNEIMELCRFAAVDPKPYLDQVRNAI